MSSASADGSQPTSPIRLTPAFLHILLAVAREPRHGYAIMRAVQDRTKGAVRLGPGSLYWAIKRLAEAGLIAESRPAAQPDDRVRRYYGLTPRGRQALRREVEVLADIVGYAESQQLIRRSDRG